MLCRAAGRSCTGHMLKLNYILLLHEPARGQHVNTVLGQRLIQQSSIEGTWVGEAGAVGSRLILGQHVWLRAPAWLVDECLVCMPQFTLKRKHVAMLHRHCCNIVCWLEKGAAEAEKLCLITPRSSAAYSNSLRTIETRLSMLTVTHGRLRNAGARALGAGCGSKASCQASGIKSSREHGAYTGPLCCRHRL